MASLAKLKDRARKYEQKEDWQAAIAAYQQVLEQEEGADEIELELGLYNRIGDLYLRLGQTDEAVSYYETAADKYADSGFFNNAIALCNKALRHRPDRPEIYLKLSGLCAEQGFQTDARRWILEYAERQMKAGRVEKALSGLENFADLSDDPEVRESLAQQLASHDRPEEAIEQLAHAYRLHSRKGADAAAARVAERARAIDPSVDLESREPGPYTARPEARPANAPLEELGPAAPPAPPDASPGVAGLETRREDTPAGAGSTPGAVDGLEGLEATGAEPEPETVEEAPSPSGLEVSQSHRTPVTPPESTDADALGGLETFDRGTGPGEPDAGVEAHPVDAEPAETEEGDPLPFLDTGYEDQVDDEDDVEPLPLIDTGFDEEEPELEDGSESEAEPDVESEEDAEPEVEAEPQVEAGREAGEEPEAEAEPEVEDEPKVAAEPEVEADSDAEDAEDAEAEFGAGLVDLPSLDLGGIGGPVGADNPPRGELEGAEAAEAMDLDFSSFGLGGNEPVAPAQDLDIEAVLQRGREMVSRGLTGAALQELRLLSGSTGGPDVFLDALGIINEIIRHDANDLAALQRRVEYSARTGDKELLVDAYTDLADALARLGAEAKAQAMYGRVLDLDPDNEAAREALGEIPEGEAEDDAVDLAAVLRDVDPDEVEPASPVGESDPGFAAMLSQFRAKVTDRAELGEAGDHYDLGLAFKEMGLIDEAIAEFQTALTGGTERLKVYEELGQCFIQNNQPNVALKVLNRALQVPYTDESERLGVYYHLGQVHEELGQRAEARQAYEKVLAIDETFGDVPDRVARL